MTAADPLFKTTFKKDWLNPVKSLPYGTLIQFKKKVERPFLQLDDKTKNMGFGGAALLQLIIKIQYLRPVGGWVGLPYSCSILQLKYL